MKILEVKNLRKEYGQGETLVKALDGVNLSVEKGEFLAVVGSSGSGKSTLLHMMGGLDVPTSGEVIVDGRNLAKMKDEQLTIFRRRNIGFVFQSYNLVPMLNVMENITLPLGFSTGPLALARRAAANRNWAITSNKNRGAAIIITNIRPKMKSWLSQ